ncbi:Cyp2j5: Cytochrome protein, partial [Crotalus adamanteus]
TRRKAKSHQIKEDNHLQINQKVSKIKIQQENDGNRDIFVCFAACSADCVFLQTILVPKTFASWSFSSTSYWDLVG